MSATDAHSDVTDVQILQGEVPDPLSTTVYCINPSIIPDNQLFSVNVWYAQSSQESSGAATARYSADGWFNTFVDCSREDMSEIFTSTLKACGEISPIGNVKKKGVLTSRVFSNLEKALQFSAEHSVLLMIRRDRIRIWYPDSMISTENMDVHLLCALVVFDIVTRLNSINNRLIDALALE
jgi:hypothetical protein